MSFDDDFNAVFAPPYVPPMKRFPDGDYVSYHLTTDGRVMGQLYRKGGRTIRKPFPYEGPNPAPWDKR